MSTSLFEVEGDRYRPTELSTGPWSQDALHGGPVAALLAHRLESEPGGEGMFPARLTLELLRPVDHEPMDISVEVVRPGKKVRVLEARLTRPGNPVVTVARANLQQIRRTPIALPAEHRSIDPVDAPPHLSDDLPTPDPAIRLDDPPAFHNTAVELRTADGFFDHLGPAFAWIRVLVDLVPGVALSPFARVAAAADFGNGVSATLPIPDYVFVNPDLTIVLSESAGGRMGRSRRAHTSGRQRRGLRRVCVVRPTGPDRSIDPVAADRRARLTDGVRSSRWPWAGCRATPLHPARCGSPRSRR